MHSKPIVGQSLSEICIRINGPNPWDIHMHDDGFYARLLKNGRLGLGEPSMKGWWDCLRIDEFMQ
jgi:cyclopropane-fatty-acyl-phospholipid synthase